LVRCIIITYVGFVCIVSSSHVLLPFMQTAQHDGDCHRQFSGSVAAAALLCGLSQPCELCSPKLATSMTLDRCLIGLLQLSRARQLICGCPSVCGPHGPCWSVGFTFCECLHGFSLPLLPLTAVRPTPMLAWPTRCSAADVWIRSSDARLAPTCRARVLGSDVVGFGWFASRSWTPSGSTSLLQCTRTQRVAF
jgi:hypothetical protein